MPTYSSSTVSDLFLAKLSLTDGDLEVKAESSRGRGLHSFALFESKEGIPDRLTSPSVELNYRLL